MSPDKTGQVITFYSYKGGTGRSMALANVACLLAQRQAVDASRRVLMVDWDLEAPGLHRYFRDKFHTELGTPAASTPSPAEYDKLLDERKGLIDLFIELDRLTAGIEQQDEEAARALVQHLDFDEFIMSTDVPSLDIMKAGRFDEKYAANVSTFQWEALFHRSPSLIRTFGEYLAEHYQFVLIDSRTGITDISGICTMLLPEKLVVVFTPNRQSLLGVEELVRRATRYRRQSEDLRPLSVFPLPSRIEMTEPRLKDLWRLGGVENDIPAYQPLFERLFENVYDVKNCDLTHYFDEVEIQHAPSYSYGENIAVLAERTGSRLSLRLGFDTFANYLSKNEVPWETALAKQTSPSVQSQLMRAEATFAALSVAEQADTKQLFTRLVRLARPEEGGEDTTQRVGFDDLSEAEQLVAQEWSKANLLKISQDEKGSNTAVEPVSETLVREWKRLRNWLEEDREFFLWRQAMRAESMRWITGGRRDDALLVGQPLHEALAMRKTHMLSASELDFINVSAALAEGRKFQVVAKRLLIGLGILLLVLVGIFAYRWQRPKVVKPDPKAEQAKVLQSQGEALVVSGDYSSAIKVLSDAIGLDPNSARAYFHRGYAYYHTGAYGSAYQDYNAAIKLKPDYAEAFLQLGYVKAFGLGLTNPQRQKDFDEAIRLKPNWAEPYVARAVCEVDQNSLESALPYLNQAIQLEPDNLSALSWRQYVMGKLRRPVPPTTSIPYRKKSVGDLFSDNDDARGAGVDAIMTSYLKDPGLVTDLLDYARQHRDNEIGIYNTLVMLSYVDASVKRDHVEELRVFAREFEGMGPRIKVRAEILLGQLPN